MTETPAPPEHLIGKEDLKLIAYVWDCGDPDCDCTEPVIAWQWRERPPGVFVPFYRREAIWTGTFVTRGLWLDPDAPDPDEELAEACARLGIEPRTAE